MQKPKTGNSNNNHPLRQPTMSPSYKWGRTSVQGQGKSVHFLFNLSFKNVHVPIIYYSKTSPQEEFFPVFNVF